MRGFLFGVVRSIAGGFIPLDIVGVFLRGLSTRGEATAAADVRGDQESKK
jgi:hypothetical protein